MRWILVGLVAPLYVAVEYSPTYGVGVTAIVVGVLLYVVNAVLIRRYVSRFDPGMVHTDAWEITAGLGVVPRWVSVVGLLGFGLAISGIVTCVLLAVGVIAPAG